MGRNVRVWSRKVKTHKRVEAYQNTQNGSSPPDFGGFYAGPNDAAVRRRPPAESAVLERPGPLSKRPPRTNCCGNTQLQVGLHRLLSQRKRWNFTQSWPSPFGARVSAAPGAKREPRAAQRKVYNSK